MLAIGRSACQTSATVARLRLEPSSCGESGCSLIGSCYAQTNSHELSRRSRSLPRLFRHSHKRKYCLRIRRRGSKYDGKEGLRARKVQGLLPAGSGRRSVGRLQGQSLQAQSGLPDPTAAKGSLSVAEDRFQGRRPCRSEGLSSDLEIRRQTTRAESSSSVRTTRPNCRQRKPIRG